MYYARDSFTTTSILVLERIFLYCKVHSCTTPKIPLLQGPVLVHSSDVDTRIRIAIAHPGRGSHVHVSFAPPARCRSMSNRPDKWQLPLIATYLLTRISGVSLIPPHNRNGVHSCTTYAIPLLQHPFLYCIGDSFTAGTMSILGLHERFLYCRVHSCTTPTIPLLHGPFLYYV